ncbi:MAG TPA: hypothetical protein VFZ17_14690 [Acidimicrobiia bacterium]|nr:hypothetical protein [Acidimicrobiia bacterium]
MNATTAVRAPQTARSREHLVTELFRYVQDELAARESGMWL